MSIQQTPCSSLRVTFGHCLSRESWEYESFFTSKELHKPYNHFFHPESRWLHSMMRRAAGSHTNPSDLKELERIASECNACQRNIATTSRFRTALPPEDVVFKRCLSMYIMFLDGMVVLRIVYKEKTFSAASLLPIRPPTGSGILILCIELSLTSVTSLRSMSTKDLSFVQRDSFHIQA